jgi:hypothetical protein
MRSEIGKWWRYVKHLWEIRSWSERLAMFVLHALVVSTIVAVTVFLVGFSIYAAATFWQVAITLSFIVFLAWAVWVVNRD